MNAFSQTKLENLGLETPLQEILNLQGQHIIETHASLVLYTNTDETTDKGISLEETLRVLVVKLEQLTGSTTNPQACCGTGCSHLAVVPRGPVQKKKQYKFQKSITLPFCFLRHLGTTKIISVWQGPQPRHLASVAVAD